MDFKRPAMNYLESANSQKMLHLENFEHIENLENKSKDDDKFIILKKGSNYNNPLPTYISKINLENNFDN